MSGMPYHLEKGPIISVLEAFANQNVPQLGAALTKLRDPTIPLVTIGAVDSTTLRSTTFPDQWRLVHHINTHWLGMTSTKGTWAPQPAFDPSHPATTGHWQHYHGPVEEILRETFIRAAEVSLGLDHGDPVPATPVRHWPVEFFWKCPQPWFEGWVTWRRSGNGDGQVTVVLATPADTGVVLDSPVKGRNCQVNPTTTKPVHPTTKKPKESRQGMWVVTARQHRQHVASTTAPSPSGQITLPSSVWCGEQGVVTVAPHFYDGGASPDGLGYTPGWKP